MDISEVRTPSPTPVPLAQGSSARKISTHNFWLQKPVRLSRWKKLLESQVVYMHYTWENTAYMGAHYTQQNTILTQH